MKWDCISPPRFIASPFIFGRMSNVSVKSPYWVAILIRHFDSPYCFTMKCPNHFGLQLFHVFSEFCCLYFIFDYSIVLVWQIPLISMSFPWRNHTIKSRNRSLWSTGEWLFLGVVRRSWWSKADPLFQLIYLIIHYSIPFDFELHASMKDICCNCFFVSLLYATAFTETLLFSESLVKFEMPES